MTKKILIGLILSVATNCGYTQLWETLDGGFTELAWGGPRVFYIDSETNSLILGGGFWNAANGDTLAKIANWDGSVLTPLGCGFDWNCLPDDDLVSGYVSSIIRYNGELIASGSMNRSCGLEVSKVCRFNGACWESFGPIDATLADFKIHNDTLYACGVDTCNGLDCNGFAKWNGTTWIPAAQLPNFNANSDQNGIQTFEWYQGNIYLGGNWNYNGTDYNYDDLIMWNGTSWSPVGDGIFGTFGWVKKLTVFQDKLIAIGGFSGPSNPGNFIAAWNGTTWDNMAGGFQNPNSPSSFYPIHDMWATEEFLYVVGAFKFAGGIPAHNIARWDGSEWCGYGSGEMFEGSYWENAIHSVCVYNDELIVGGDFLANEDNPSLGLIAKYVGPDSCLFSGVEEEQENLVFSVFPNPAMDFITLKGLPKNSSSKIEIFDTDGRMVKTDANTSIVEIRNLASGIYFVTVSSNESLYRSKFVKE